MPARPIKFTRAEVAAYYTARLPDLKQTDSDEWRGACPIHQGDRDSFAVDSETGRFFCHSECGRGGSIIKLEMEITRADLKTARREVFRIIGREWRTVARYVYTDESGRPLFRVIRRERGTGEHREKTFHLERYERGRWRKGLGDVRRVLYRLHKVANARRVFIVEGEKDANTLRKLKFIATTNPMGAGKWSEEYTAPFKGKHVFIIPDNDSAGRTHALTVATSLLSVAASVRMLELPGLLEKGDVTDWVRGGGTREQLEALLKATTVLSETSLTGLREQWKLDHAHLKERFPFRVTNEGVFSLKEGDAEPVKIAARVDVIAQTRDAAGENWGRLLQWKDNEGRVHTWAMPMEMLASDAGAVRARLLAEGLPFIATSARLRERFTEFLQTAPIDRRTLCVARIGWHGDAYVLPDVAIVTDGAGEVLYQTPHEAVHHWNVRGTVDEWREHVGRLCGGNSRLMLAVSCGFAGPLLSLVGAEAGGIHFHGATSTGKSTALLVGGSVCGGGGQNGFVQTWRTTINGLEAIAEAHNDATLFLDEVSQVDPREAAENAYLLANGQGKNRMTRSIGARKKLTWGLLFVSAGELTLAEHAASAGKHTRGGAEVRLLNIDADAGAGMGLFEDLNGGASPDVFAHQMKDAALRFYGAPFRAFLEQLVVRRERVKTFVLKVQKSILNCVPSDASGEIRRAAERFGLIAAAGELATRFGLTGWQKNEAIRVAKRVFHEWLKNRGSTGPSDADAGIRAVRSFIQTNGPSRFETIRSVRYTDNREIIRDRAGFVRLDGGEPKEYLFFPEIFRNEVCNGHSWRAVLKELDARGYLRREPPNMTMKPNLPGTGRTRVYCVRASLLKGDE